VKSGGLPKSDPKIRIDGPGAHLWIIEPGNAQPGTVGQSPVEFRWTDAGWKATEAAGTSRARPLALPARATLEIMALRDEPQRLKLSGATSIAGGKESEWPGTVRLVPQPTDPNEPVDVVHEVPMETYLPGVLAQELFNAASTPSRGRAVRCFFGLVAWCPRTTRVAAAVNARARATRFPRRLCMTFRR
jgi:hypothetical protein